MTTARRLCKRDHALLHWLLLHLRRGAHKPLAKAAGAATAAGRVLTESHWLSDTVAGAALGVAALAAAVALANDADVR